MSDPTKWIATVITVILLMISGGVAWGTATASVNVLEQKVDKMVPRDEYTAQMNNLNTVLMDVKSAVVRIENRQIQGR